MKNQVIIAPLGAQPKKLFYRIKEVAKMTGVQPYVLRYWETEFPELSPEKDASDQRRYRFKDIQTIQAIRKLLYEDKFTIKGAQRKIKQELRSMTASTQTGSETAELKPDLPKAEPIGELVDIPKSLKSVNLYTRALSDNLSLLRKEVNDLMGLLKS